MRRSLVAPSPSSVVEGRRTDGTLAACLAQEVLVYLFRAEKKGCPIHMCQLAAFRITVKGGALRTCQPNTVTDHTNMAIVEVLAEFGIPRIAEKILHVLVV